MRNEQITELLYQAYEVEQGGVKIYETALKCVENDELREEWEEYLDQTREHVEIVRGLMEGMDLDPEVETPGRGVCRHLGESLVKAMEMALEAGVPGAAQLVAAECVVLAETKDHLDWELIGEIAGELKGAEGKSLKEAHEKVEDQEDEHLYHTKGWARELWIESLGLPAVLPPPEEKKDVKTAIQAARAQSSRKRMKKSKD